MPLNACLQDKSTFIEASNSLRESIMTLDNAK